jgi:hypothetical protein
MISSVEELFIRKFINKEDISQLQIPKDLIPNSKDSPSISSPVLEDNVKIPCLKTCKDGKKNDRKGLKKGKKIKPDQQKSKFKANKRKNKISQIDEEYETQTSACSKGRISNLKVCENYFKEIQKELHELKQFVAEFLQIKRI